MARCARRGGSSVAEPPNLTPHIVSPNWMTNPVRKQAQHEPIDGLSALIQEHWSRSRRRRFVIWLTKTGLGY